MYWKGEISARSEFTMSEFMRQDDVTADIEIITSRGVLDSNIEDRFDLTFSTRTKGYLLRRNLPRWWRAARSKQMERLRIRGKHNGVSYTGDFRDLGTEFAELKLTRKAALEFGIPLKQHHDKISPMVRDQLDKMMEDQ